MAPALVVYYRHISFNPFLVCLYTDSHPCAHPEGGTGGPDPPEKSQNIGFLSNTDPDSLKNHEATKPAFNVWLSSARQ